MSDDDGHHHHPVPPSPVEARARALEELLTEKGIVQPDALDAVVTMYERDIGPLNGARVVARAWVDPEYKRRLLDDGTAAIAELGFGGPEGEHMVVVENTPDVHNVVVCTLCSCYPWPVLGLPPTWYKSPAYRTRMVREPRVAPARDGTGSAGAGRDPGLGLQRGDALPRAARAAARCERARARKSWPRWSAGTP